MKVKKITIQYERGNKLLNDKLKKYTDIPDIGAWVRETATITPKKGFDHIDFDDKLKQETLDGFMKIWNEAGFEIRNVKFTIEL